MAPERSPRSLLRKTEGTAFPLHTLEAIRDLRRYLDQVEADALRRARELGASPSDIAEALGVTRQGVYHKLKLLDVRAPRRAAETEAGEPVVIPELEPETE